MERLELLAARHILSGLGEEQDVGKSRRRRCCSEQDEEGRDAFRGAALNDSGVLRQVADEHAHHNETTRTSAGGMGPASSSLIPHTWTR